MKHCTYLAVYGHDLLLTLRLFIYRAYAKFTYLSGPYFLGVGVNALAFNFDRQLSLFPPDAFHFLLPKKVRASAASHKSGLQ